MSKISDIVDSGVAIKFFLQNGRMIKFTTNDAKLVMSPFNFKLMFDISKHVANFSEDHKSQLCYVEIFNNKHSKETELKAELCYKAVYAKRNLFSNGHYSRGDQMVMHEGKVSSYNLNMELTQDDVKMKRNECYDDRHADSYLGRFQHCDENFVKDMYRQLDLGYSNPIWNGHNGKKISPELFNTKVNPSTVHQLFNLASGSIPNKCLLPCLTLQTESKKVGVEPLTPNTSGIAMYFPEKVKKLTVKKDTFDPWIMLSLVGGNMGLWLGWSVSQILIRMTKQCKI